MLKDEDYWAFTGLHTADFDDLLECIANKIRDSENRSAHTCLAIFLMKLCTGLSHNVLFTLPKCTVSTCIHSCHRAGMTDFVPLQLDLNLIS